MTCQCIECVGDMPEPTDAEIIKMLEGRRDELQGQLNDSAKGLLKAHRTILDIERQRDELQAENDVMKRDITAKFDADYLRRVLATAKVKP